MSAQPCRVDTPDRHEPHTHLTLVPEPAREMCERCGVRPKKSGRGQKLCVECPPIPRTRLRDRPDKPPTPCLRCGADRVGDPFPYNSRLCSGCAEDRGEDLPKIPLKVSSAPLAAVLERIIAREGAIEPWARFMHIDDKSGHRAKDPRGWMAPGARREGVCARAGISPKTLLEWREGRRTMVPWNKADAVLQNLGLSWDDVWTPQTAAPDEYRALREAMCCV